MIVAGSTSQTLAAALADALDEPLAAVEHTAFPDGEFKLRLAGADGVGDGIEAGIGNGSGSGAGADAETALATADRAVIVASTTSADAHLEVLQLQDAALEAGIDEVVTILPYMGYARQDRAFEPGEPVTARAVARALSAGTDRVLTVCPHEPATCEFFEPTAEPIDAAPRLADPLPGDLAEPVFLAPDAGATGLAETVRDAYGAGTVDHFEKRRHSGTEVAIEPGTVDVAERDVVVVDDIVATGTTMSEAIAALGEQGAGDVHVACVHALFARDARSKLARAGVAGIHATDTIERPVSSVSVAPAIASEL